MTNIIEHVKNITNWNADENYTETLIADIRAIRCIHPEITINELAEMAKKPFFGSDEDKELILRYYPTALACSKSWFVMFPDGTRRDVEGEIRNLMQVDNHLSEFLKDIKYIVKFNPHCNVVGALSCKYDEIKKKYPTIKLVDLLALRTESMFANGEEKRVKGICPDALGYDHTGWIILEGGDFHPLTYYL